MTTFYWLLVFISTFIFMEFMAWFTHKYVHAWISMVVTQRPPSQGS